MSLIGWIAIVDGILGLLIAGLAYTIYIQHAEISELREHVKALEKDVPTNWDSEVKSEWGISDETNNL